MKSRVGVLSTLLIVAFLAVPSLVVSDQIATPMERSIFPGVTTVQYSGQTLVFTTAEPLKIKLRVVPAGYVELSFMKAPSRGGSQGARSSAGGQTVVFWEQSAENLYSGFAPEGWFDIPLTEGGWTEK